MQKQCDISDAMARKYPEQVVLVATNNGKKAGNVMAVGWTCVVSGAPLMLAFGIDDGSFTYQLIRRNRDFVVAFPSTKMARQTLFAGSKHGFKIDKIKAGGFAAAKASAVSAPLLSDAVVNLECRLVKIYKPGDCPVIIGRVVAAHQNADRRLKRLYTVGKNHTMGSVRSRAVS